MKVSLRALFFWIAFSALVAAALARPSVLWTRLIFSFTLAFLGWTIVGAIATRGKNRVFWSASAIFGLGYLFLISSETQSPYGGPSFTVGRTLVTHELLNWVGKGIGHKYGYGSANVTLWDPSMFAADGGAPSMAYSSQPATVVTTGVPYYAPAMPDVTAAEGAAESLDQSGDLAGSGPTPTALVPQTYVPPASTTLPPVYTFTMSPITSGGAYSQFLLSGHCAFLVLIALSAGLLARWMFGATEETARPPANTSPNTPRGQGTA